MEERLRHIVKEEFEKVMSNGYDEREIRDAIMNKHFIHTKNGNVYCPVKIEKDLVTGVNNDSEHIDIPLDEIALIQSAEERFGIR